MNGGEPLNNEVFNRNTEGPFHKPSLLDRRNPQLIKILQDAFFSSGRSIEQLFEISATDERTMDMEGLKFICKKFTPSFSESEIQQLYKFLVPERGK